VGFDLNGSQSVTTFLLIRHALCDPVGKAIAGRAPGVHLNPAGRQQAAELAAWLAPLPIRSIYSSPLERAVETATPLAARIGLPVVRVEGLSEVDFGDWTGRSLEDLAAVPGWHDFNARRSTARIPNGETMAEVVSRAGRALADIRLEDASPDRLVAVVSHGDVLRGLLTDFLAMPADELARLEIAPASVTVVSLQGQAPRVLLLNATLGWPEGISATR
jgi:probable phosphomutase (TIGR03848 family)